ncbi:MAG: hypothetical protein WBV94_21715 [Blastocatellia bacterium]
MNTDQVIAYVESRVGPREVTSIEPEEIEAMIPAARTRAAREAWKEGFRGLTDKVYSLTLDANGKADFSAQTDLLPESVPLCNDIQHATVNAAVGLPFEILASVGALKAVRPTSQLAYAAVGEQAVHARYPAGTLTNGSTLLVRANKIPTLGAWPTQIEDRLLDAVVELVKERMGLLPPEEVNSGVSAM